MAYWAVARLQPHRERLALHCLGLAGFTMYLPRLSAKRVSNGRCIEISPPLFPGYAFVLIELQWSKARYAPGIMGLIMNGAGPARVPDQVIAGIRAHEVRGAVELPKSFGLKPGDYVKILGGPFRGHLALYAGMKSRQRVEVLLALLGGQQRLILPRADVEASLAAS
jgi:transcription antitermination factor NusG